MTGKDAISICYFGECAVSDGDFHVSLNIATMIDCPVMFYRQNNGYAMSMPSEQQFASDVIARGIGYSEQTIRVNSNDALSIYAATQKA